MGRNDHWECTISYLITWASQSFFLILNQDLQSIIAVRVIFFSRDNITLFLFYSVLVKHRTTETIFLRAMPKLVGMKIFQHNNKKNCISSGPVNISEVHCSTLSQLINIKQQSFCVLKNSATTIQSTLRTIHLYSHAFMEEAYRLLEAQLTYCSTKNW